MISTPESDEGRHSFEGRPVRVLLLEDDEPSANLFCRYLREGQGPASKVVVARTLAQALERLAAARFDLVLADLNLPDSSGVDTMERLASAGAPLTIVLTGIIEPDLRDRVLALGAYDVLTKDEASKPALERLVRLAAIQARTFASLRESEARFRSLVTRSFDWYWEQDEALRFTKFGGPIDDAARRAQATGQRRWELPGITPLSSTWEEHRAVLEERKPFRDFQYSRPGADGELEYLSICGEPVFDDEAAFRGYRGVASNITQRKRTERALRESEERFRRLLELSSDWYWEQDALFRLTFMSPHLEQKTGLDADAFLGRTSWEQPASNLTEADWARHRAQLERHEAFKDFEIERLTPEGASVWVSLSGEPVFSESGEFRGYRGIGKDITARRRAQRALADTKARKSAILDASMDAIVTVDDSDGIVEFNAAANRYFRYSRSAAIGRTMAELLFPPEHRAAHRDRLSELAADLRSSPEMRTEVTVLRADGSRFDAELAMVRIPESDPPLFTSTFRDITERKRAERLLGLEHSVTRALAQAETPSEAVRVVLRAVCESQKWEMARYFEADEAGQVMRITESWSSGAGRTEDLNTQWRNAEYRRGQGLMGSVWESGEGLWVEDITRDSRVAQKALALKAGVRGAILYPVKFDGEVIGVLSFLSKAVREPDQRLLDTLRVIAAQVGQFLMRKRAEDTLREREARLRAIVDNEPECVKILDSDGRVLDMNPAGLRMIEAESFDVVCGQVVEPIVAPEYRRAFRELHARVIGGEEGELEFQIVGLKGTQRWMESRAVPLRDEATGKPLMLSITRDITERKRAEARQAAHLRYQQQLAVFGRSALDRREPGELFQGAVHSLFEGLGGDVVAYIERGAASDELALRAVAGALSGELERYGFMRAASSPLFDAIDSGVRFVADGVTLPFEWARDMRSTAIVPVHAGGVRGALCVFRASADPIPAEEVNFVDATANLLSAGLQRIGSENRAAFLAQFDALTGLPNRALLSDRFSQMIVQARRRGTPLGVLFIDLDGFKLVNDSFGRAAGDELLKEAGRRLQISVRAQDTVARITGDEFAVVLADLAKAEDAAVVAQKIIERLAAPFVVGEKEMFVTASVGIAAFPGDGDAPEALLGAADAAMHRAKQYGRNAYQFFTPEINQRTRAKAALRSELRRALDRGEFTLSYQPKIDLATGETCGAEALLRWQHPERGIIAPSEFIPVLEDTGLIVQVGEWVIAQACRDLKAWSAAGIRLMPVAVNLSPRQFKQQDLDERIRALIGATGIDPSLIELEITESHLMQDPDHAIRVVRGLRDAGIKVAVDDFGTGYSSLAYLTRFPVSALKIDRSFVAGIKHQNGDAAIVRTIVEMARTLGLTVVAEGVETAEQVTYLRGLGCQQAQGFFFSQPLQLTEFTALIARLAAASPPPGRHPHPSMAGAAWSVEAAPAEARPAAAVNLNQEDLSGLDLLGYLEKVAGRRIASRDDARAYIAEMSSQQVVIKASTTRWRSAKRALLGIALTFAVFEYYAIDILLQILSIPQVTFFVPAATTILKSLFPPAIIG